MAPKQHKAAKVQANKKFTHFAIYVSQAEAFLMLEAYFGIGTVKSRAVLNHVFMGLKKELLRVSNQRPA